MRQFFVLLKNDIRNMIPFRKFKEKPWKLVLLILGCLAGIVGIGVYEAMFLDLALQFGAPALFFGLIALIEIVLTFFSTVRTAAAQLFMSKDYDLLFSMPVKPALVLSEKMTRLYVYNTLSVLFTGIPAIVLYGVMAKPDLVFYLLALPVFLAITVLPMLFGTVIALLFTWIASRFTRIKAVTSLLYLLFFVVIVLFSGFVGGASSADPEQLMDLTKTINDTLFANPLMFSGRWFVEALVDGNLVSAALLVGTSLVAFVLFVFLFTRMFSGINDALKESPQRKNYKLTRQKSGSVMKALLGREWQFATYNHTVMLNTFVGPAMVLMAGLAAFFGLPYLLKEIIKEAGSAIAGGTDIAGEMFAMMETWSGVVVGGVLCVYFYMLNLAPTACFSISIEGKSFWLTKSMPVPVAKIFMAKYGFQLVLAIPTLVVSLALFALALRLPLMNIAIIFVVVLLDTLLSSSFALLMNLIFPKMHWEQPAQVVKQSMATFIVTFAHLIGFGVLLASFVLLFINGILITGPGLNQGVDTFFFLLIGVQLVMVTVVMVLLHTVGKKKFLAIEA